MKNYKVKIKKIQVSDMIVRAESKDDAIVSVNKLLNKCIDNNVDLLKTFNAIPHFIFDIEELQDDE